MTKITKLFSLVACLVFAVTLFTSIAYADIPAPPDCLPGQDPKTSFCTPANSNKNANNRNNRNGQNEIITYAIVGGAVLVVTAVSAVVLIKIRRRNVK